LKIIQGKRDIAIGPKTGIAIASTHNESSARRRHNGSSDAMTAAANANATAPITTTCSLSALAMLTVLSSRTLGPSENPAAKVKSV
jgi:hypothetical protein